MSAENAARVIVDGGWRRLAPGTRIAGRFEVIELLGEGGMGAVYVAHDANIGRRVALKLLLVRSPKAAARFKHEARAISRVSSRHVSAVHDFGEDPEHGLYMVMELLAGSPLDAVLAGQGALEPTQAAGIGADIAEALAAAHGQGVVHRDLKPANVMLLEEGGLKVLDFGIARVTEGDDELASTKLTAEGMVIGTPTYISPEGASAKEVGPQADLYSLGVMLFEMVTGRPPFVDDLPVALLTAHVRQPAPSIGALQPELALPDGFTDLVAALLEKDPDKRPRSALEVAEVLRGMSSGEAPLRLAGESVGYGAPTAQNVSAIREAPSSVRRWIPLALIVSLVALSVGAALVVSLGNRPEQDEERAAIENEESEAHRSRAERAAPPEDEAAAPEPSPASPPDELPSGVRPEATPPTPPDELPSGVEPPAAPATVQVEIATRPSRAQVRLDGEIVEPPLSLPADGAEHELTILARGYRPARRVITADRDHSLEIVLRRRPRGRRLPAKMREW